MNDGSKLGHDGDDIGGLAGLPGLKAVRDQLAARIAVLRAEQGRRAAGVEVRRPAWKNLVFTRGPGTGKSRAAAAVARAYRDLGLLPLGHVAEAEAADLADPKPWEAARLVDEAAHLVPGGVLMITDAHAWYDLPDHGRQMLRCLYQLLTQAQDRVREDLAVILAGRARPLGELLRTSPALAARFPAVIDFPGYIADELTAIFATLTEEAGFTLTPDAARKAALQPGADGPLPGHLHVISTGSTAGLHIGLVGCGDTDDGGVGQAGHDPAGIAAVGLVHPGRLGSDPVQGRNMIRASRPGLAGPAHRHARTGGRACC